MNTILHAHSGFRFLILLLAVANLIVLGASLAQKRPFGTFHRVLGSAYVGFLHLQVLLGIAVVGMGLYYPKLMGHIVCMLLATVAAQVPMAVNKKRPTPGFQLPLAGVAGSLLLIVGGIMAIGRGLFEMTPR